MDAHDLQGSASRHAWLRWAWVWHVAFTLALGLGWLGALRGGAPPSAVHVVALGLGGAYAWTNVVRPPPSAVGRAFGMVLLWGLWLAALWLDDAFVPVGAFLAAHVCYLSLRWAVPVAALFVAGVAARDVLLDGGPSPALVGPVAAAAAVGVVLAAYVSAIARESEARAALIGQLRSTRADLAAAEHVRGVLEERGRVARDVHDTLAQSFTSVITQLQAAQAAVTDDRHGEHVTRALDAARDGLREARRIVWDLDIDVPTLEQGLATLAAASANQHVAVDTRVDGTPRAVPEDVRRELLAVTREALTNVARHAGTNRAAIHLAYSGDVITLEIVDDGLGFDQRTPNGGYGLRSMRDRASRVRARVDVRSSPGAGTSIRLRAPCP